MGNEYMTRGVAVTIALTLCASGASAQTLPDSARAARVSLLSQANEAQRAGHLEEALRLGLQAEQIGATAGTRMFIAQVHAQLSHHASALTSAEQCIREVDIDAQTTVANRQAIRTACETVRDEALRRVGRLVVSVPAGAPAMMIVRVNGQVLRAPLYNVEQVVDAGAIAVTATLGELPPWEQRETVAAGSRATVSVVVPTATRAVEQPRSTEVTPSGDGSARVPTTTPGSTQRALAWASGATGIALVAAGAISGAMFQGTASDYAAAQCETTLPTDDCRAMYDRLGTLNTVQWVGYIGGGALAVTSAVLFLTAPSAAAREHAVACGIGPGTLGLSCATRF